MHRLTFLLLFLIISSTCLAQWQIAAGIQPAKMSIIDKDFSYSPFSAIVPGAAMSVSHISDHSIHTLSFSYAWGDLKTSTQPRYELDQHYFNADYSWLYRLGSPDGKWTGGVGGALQVLYNNRTYTDIINNNTSFDFAASLGLAGSISYAFNNDLHGWSLSDQLHIPFVSWLIQPPYDNESTTAAITDAANRQKIAGPTTFMRFKNTFSLNRQLSSGGIFSLAYDWDYYRINDLREVRLVNHSLSLIYRLTL